MKAFRKLLKDQKTQGSSKHQGQEMKRRNLGQSWQGRGKVLSESNKQADGKQQSKTQQSSSSIYHIPSVFFNELVERDRGLRMILMVWLFLPHPHALHV